MNPDAIKAATDAGFEAGYELEPTSNCPHKAGPLRKAWMSGYGGGKSLKRRHVLRDIKREEQEREAND